MSKESPDSSSKSKRRKEEEELQREITNHNNKNKNDNNDDNDDDQTLWNSIAKNYEMIQGAQIANSFILLAVLSNAKEPLSTTII